jgi:hypothetical protein
MAAMLSGSFQHRRIGWRGQIRTTKSKWERSMTAHNGHARTLRATLCEIERGLFYATYRTVGAVADEMPAYQLGTDAADAKRKIEAIVGALGYHTIIWEDTIVVPLSQPEGRDRSRNSASI